MAAGMLDAYDDNALLTTAEVAALFGVSRKTVARWAEAGLIPTFRTLGGHRRIRARDVRRFLRGSTPAA
jgi:excisionase family DNA binding protein